MKKLLLALAVAGLTAATGPASAVPSCILGAGNVGLSSVDCSFDEQTNTITIREVWTSAGMGSVQIEGLDQGVAYTVIKLITNNSGVDWSRLANELLDPAGQANDDSDPQPYPGFVPPGFTTSNDGDGLSFAQGGGIPRDSDIWSTVFADELSDARDFLDYFNGILVDGGVGQVRFGLSDNQVANNEPFLLVQRPNVSSRTPEPGTLALLGLGALAFALRRRSA